MWSDALDANLLGIMLPVIEYTELDICLLRLYLLTNFAIQKYFQNTLKFKDIHSRNDLANTMKDGTYTVILDECKSIEAQWIC